MSNKSPLEVKKTHHALSLGAGVNSTALLILVTKDKLPLNEVVFADTGVEHLETYSYIERWIKPFCAERGIPLTTVSAVDRPNLEDFCHLKHCTPSRLHRWCTEKWKIIPIYRHLPRPCTIYMGICWDEVHRMGRPHVKGGAQVTVEYPLIDQKIGRAGCEKIIIDHGLPIPIKSGCFFCPFTSLAGWRDLWQKHPEMYDRAIAVERLDKSYPKYPLTGNGIPLERLRNRWGYGDKKIEDYFVEPCDSGFCMV